MSTTTTAVERYQQVMSEAEQTTLLGFLAGYRGSTRDAYTLDLRQFTAWCWRRQHRLFEVRRVDIECFARHLEDRGKARGDGGAPVVHDRRLLPCTGTNRTPKHQPDRRSAGAVSRQPGRAAD
jgi:hypothetical protein